MKTEDFDDAIRKKVASIESAHDGKDVDAIHQYVRSQGKIRSKRKNIIIISTIAILIIGGLSVWNIRQVKEIRGLEQKVSELKRISVSSATTEKSSESKINVVNSDAGEDHPTIARSGNRKPPKQIAKRSILTNYFAENAAHKKDLQPVTSHKESSSKPPVENPTTHSNGLEPSNRITAADFGSRMNDKQVPDNQTPVDEVEDLKSGQDSSMPTTVLMEASPPVIDSSVAKMGFNPASHKNWNYRLGMGFEVGRLQLGLAFLGEAVFKKNWAIGIGIKLIKNGTQNFDDDDDYNDKKKNKFQSVYSGHVSDGTNKNIAIRNMILQVPLNLNYILPVKRNFALLAGVGTDIDLYIRQDVDYKHANGSADYQNKKFATNCPPVFINNVVLSTGFQKTIHRFVFQITPYLSPQIKQVDYKKEDLYYGLRFKTFFTF